MNTVYTRSASTNITLREVLLTKTISSLENTASLSSWSLLFIISQLGTSFNVGRKISPNWSCIFWVFNLPNQYVSMTFSLQTFCQIFLVSNILLRNRMKHKRTIINRFITAFVSLLIVKNRFKCRRSGINNFITHFFFVAAVRNKV